jgi:uncharacterized protein
MNPTLAIGLLMLGFGAGIFASLAGVGGGIVLTPVLALYFGVPIHQAIAASLLCVIATSTAASSVYLEKHLTNVRLGMTLELATTVGAAGAAIVAGFLDRHIIGLIFAAFLFYTAVSLAQKAWKARRDPVEANMPEYTPKNYGVGLTGSLFAGVLSGLLGIGGGPVKVPLMYLFMGVPLRAAAATSNFTIGVTAAASAWIYYGRGDIAPTIAAPVVAGVFAGAIYGARLAPKMRASYLLWMLVAVTSFLAVQMIYKIWTGQL